MRLTKLCRIVFDQIKCHAALTSDWQSAARALPTGLALAIVLLGSVRGASAEGGVDTALIVSVDVSQSVDDERYKLQMEGIAQALEDPEVVAAITAGAKGGILFSMVAWADQADLVLDWRRISSQSEAAEVAGLVRGLPKKGGEFTCLARMLRSVAVKVVPNIPMPAARVVVDVSGDGIDNCSNKDDIHAERDAVLAAGATINGLPIIVTGENTVVGSGAYRAPGFGLQELSSQPDLERTTLDQWFTDHIIGGDGAFVIAAHGYSDFGRAFRRKFVTEISALSGPVTREQSSLPGSSRRQAGR
jgi:Protein of unknown function (DUF1194)